MSGSNIQKLNSNSINLSGKSKKLQQYQPQQIKYSPQQQQQNQHQQLTFAASVHQQHPNHKSNIRQFQKIPPRYQPPPQPIGGILKQHHIPVAVTTTTTTGEGKSTTEVQLHSPRELSAQLNLKYPPEISKLKPIYIPDSGAPSRFSQLYRLQTATNNNNHNSNTNNNQILSQNQDEIKQQQHHQQLQSQDMLKFVRKTDADPTVNVSGSRLTTEQNRQLQSLLGELRTLKEANQRLCDDNQELRDLCCFLDDDRQKGRKLAREWQRFGRYTASVMRQEVSTYQNKLRQLDDKQQELIRDNLELKELCLYLDEERAHIAANTLCSNCGNVTCSPRDDGDGSSSSTNVDDLEHNLRTTLNDQTLQYVRSLERRINQLEKEKASVAENNVKNNDLVSGRPEAVVRALQVLEVREQLERDRIAEDLPANGTTIEQMDDGEKALVREMCNVVWRKLEDSNGPSIDPL